jgi:hypothetical protein
MVTTAAPSSMTQKHQFEFDRSAGRWQLQGHAALPLPVAAHERLLCLRSGRLWLTGPDESGNVRDFWLRSGDCLRLAAGSRWLAGAEPEAGWVMLEAPEVQARRGAFFAGALDGGFFAGAVAFARRAAAIARRAQGAISAGDSRASAGIVQ